MDERQRRIGENEALFREVNERVQELDRRFGAASSFEIVCECGDETCFERIPIARAAYGSLRADGATFAVSPGHIAPDVEGVVEEHGAYWVIGKRPGGPAELAEARFDG
jgi:hypothetical protein